MKITEIYEAQGNTVFSIEFMPPRNGSDINKIYNDIKMLNYDVSFITITMGSNKSLRGGTAALASMIKKKFGKEPVVHLTCVNRSKYEMENILTAFKYLEITNIMALRGDAPEGEGGFQKHPEGHQYANELVEQINAMNQGKYFLRNTDKEMGLVAEDAKYREAEKTNFCFCVAGYPEKHIEADNFDEDIKNLKRKVDAGADIIFTQMFFNAEDYKTFVEKCRNAGINNLIIPGIFPIFTKWQIDYIPKTFHVTVPEEHTQNLKKVQDDKEELKNVSVDFTTNLCRELIKAGAPGLHFYSMNNAKIVKRIINNLRKKGI